MILDPSKTYTEAEIKNIHYSEYLKLGGKKDFEEYSKNYAVFFEHTFDIFVFGDMWKYNSREESLQAVKDILKITWKELHLIFHSIDEVTAYT